MAEGPSVRAFLAVPNDPAWTESARGLVEQLRGETPQASWTRPQSWHLTVKFLGDLRPSALEELASWVEPAAAGAVPGEVLPGGAIVFPPRGPARVLGVGFAQSSVLESLSGLAREVDELAKRVGIPEERRAFHAHVTLARLRRPWPPDAVEAFRGGVETWPFPPFRVRACVLYESRLDRAGAVHTALAEWMFAGEPAGART